MPTDSELSKSDFESLFINNSRLANLQSFLNKFNPIKVMKMERMEIRHTAILGWLLDPKENHGLGDEFLKSFLAQALRGSEKSFAALNVSLGSYNDAFVRVEWNNIDIFIECPSENQLFIIENKIDSKQSTNQLSKYYDFVKKRYGQTYKIYGVFLTLNDEEPDNDHYMQINHRDIVELIDIVISENKEAMATRIFNFIGYYQEVLSEVCSMSKEQDEFKQLATKLYREHKSVLDFIFEHGKSNEFEYAMQQIGKDGEIIGVGNHEIEVSKVTNDTFSFLPVSWIKVLKTYDTKWKGCEKWWAGYPIICWLTLYERDDEQSRLTIYVEVGPLKENRINLIESIEHIYKEAKFSKNAKVEGAKYSKFVGRRHTKFVKNNIDSQDAEKIEEAARKSLEEFMKTVKEPVEKALIEFVKQLRV